MIRLRVVLLLAMFVGLAVGLAACAPSTIYRCVPTLCSAGTDAALAAQCARSSFQVLTPTDTAQPGYALGFIELDDQGQLWNRAQIDQTLGSVDTLTGKGASDYLMVVFVHGWKHSAGWSRDGGCGGDGSVKHNPGGDEDSNVSNFRVALKELSAAEADLSRKVGRPARHVVGVYVGWRGGSITTPVIEDLTFWDRKDTAHKVGHGQVTEVLERLDLLRRQRMIRNPESLSRLVVVGHSFGGAVVFSALEQILEARFVDTQSAATDPAPIEGFGNLVVLLNPAFEAQLYAPLSDLSIEQQTYAKAQLPVLAILTSVADDATGIAFPIGRWFSTWPEKQRPMERRNATTGKIEIIEERKADVDAVGHFDPYETHTLTATSRSPGDTPSGYSGPTPQDRVKILAAAAKAWEDDKPGSEIIFPGSVLRRTDNSAGRNPYLNIQVDKVLIHDHDDIWRPGVREFITSLILISSQSNNLAERAQYRQQAAE